MRNSKPQEDTLPWHRQFWPWFLIALPGSVVIASFITLGIAIERRDSLVRDNYYSDGLAINKVLDQDKVAVARAISATLAIDNTAVALTLQGQFASKPSLLTLQFIHPMKDSKDFLIELKADGAGKYSGQLPQPLRGHWYLEITDPTDAQWRLRNAINLDTAQSFHLQT